MTEDRFYALATGSGGAIAIVRVNGTDCIELLKPFLRSTKAKASPEIKPRFAHYLQWYDKERDTALDEMCLLFFPRGKSYTGDDLVELHLHSSRAILQRTFQILQSLGFRAAKPGEFTQRAFLNGKLSLTQAEAVRELIESDHLQQANIALNQLQGGLKSGIEKLREDLLNVGAHLEATLDYPEEDIDFLDSEKLIADVSDIQNTLIQVLESYDRFHYYREGVSVGIVGKPNAGKSSLLNCLLKKDRAIVTEVEGTTRDHIEEGLEIHGYKFRLIDTAGIRESNDLVEKIGIERSLQIKAEVDLVLYLMDGMKEQNLEEQRSNTLYLFNKCDLGLAQSNQEYLGRVDVLSISATNHQGIDNLKNWLTEQAQKAVGNLNYNEVPILTSHRQKESMVKAKEQLQAFKDALSSGIPMDIALVELYGCLDSLGEITGEVTSTDILDRLFEKFCIGK